MRCAATALPDAAQEINSSAGVVQGVDACKKMRRGERWRGAKRFGMRRTKPSRMQCEREGVCAGCGAGCRAGEMRGELTLLPCKIAGPRNAVGVKNVVQARCLWVPRAYRGALGCGVRAGDKDRDAEQVWSKIWLDAV